MQFLLAKQNDERRSQGLVLKQSNQQRNSAKSNHTIKPSFGTVFAIKIKHPIRDTIWQENDGHAKKNNNGNA